MIKTNTEHWPGRIVLMLAHIAGMIDLVALPVWVGTALIGQYHFNPPLAGAMVTAYLSAAVAGSLTFAPRFHRLAAQRMAPMGYAIAAGAFILLTTTANPVVMIALHVLAGFSAGTALSFTHGTIGRSARPHRLFAIVTVGLGVSGLAFLGIAQGLVPVRGGAVLFALFAALMGIAAIATAVAFPRPAAADVADADKEAQGAMVAQPIAAQVWWAIAGLTLMAVTQSTMFSFLERIGTARGFEERVQGVLIASALVNLASAALAGALERLIKPSRVALCGVVLQAMLAMILVFSGGFLPYAFSGILFVTVIIVTHTFVFGWLASNDASGRAVALTPAMVMSGAAIGPLLGGLLVAGFGIPSLGIVALVIGVVSLTCYRFAFRLAHFGQRFEVPLCRLEDVVDGDARGFDPLREGRDTLFVVRQGDRLYAWRDACPHERGTPMAWRKNAYLNADRSRIVCHAHGAQFDIATGLCLLGPCVGQSLTAVPIALGAEGVIAVGLDSPAETA